MKSKNCPTGKYYCFDDKKCKKIPTGYHIGAKGYLYPDKDNENGDVENVNGNGNGGNGNGNGGGNGGGVSEASAVLDANKKIKNKDDRKKKEAELRRLLNHAIAMKKGRAESVEPEGEELKEYSPNVTYQAKGGKKSGKLGKSSVYSLRGKDESKKDFRKSHVKDVEGGYVGGGHKPTPGSLKKEEITVEDNRVRFQKYGRTYAIMLIWRGKTYNTQIFVPNLRQPSRAELEKEIQKIYPGGRITYYAKRDYDPTDAAILVPEETKTKKKISFSIFRTKSKDKERKPEKSMDAGARAKRLLQRKEYAAKISGSTENVPDDIKDSFEIDPKAHKSAQKKSKLRNLAKGNTNPNEKTAAEKKAGGPKLYGESWQQPYKAM